MYTYSLPIPSLFLFSTYIVIEASLGISILTLIVLRHGGPDTVGLVRGWWLSGVNQQYEQILVPSPPPTPHIPPLRGRGGGGGGEYIGKMDI